MSISISAKTDYSALFSNLSSGSKNGNAGTLGINFSDYASIKNGSYSKLMKAYYTKNPTTGNNAVDQNKTTTGGSVDTATTITALKSSATALNEAAQDMLSKKEDVTVDKASTFVNQYNNMLEVTANSGNSSIKAATKDLLNITDSNQKNLSEIGITIGADNRLSIDKEKFQAADTSAVNQLFQGTGSYGYQVQFKASMVNMYAENDAAKASGIYSQGGTYTNLSAGNVLDSLL